MALAFRRGSGVVCVVNYGTAPVPLPQGEVLLSSRPVDAGRLPGEATAWVHPA